MCSTQTNVCVLTSRGMAAISSVALAGPKAQSILAKIFQRGVNNPFPPSGQAPLAGGEFRVLHGAIVDGDRMIDEVVVGYERDNTFVIHCHGNPLLVEQIVRLVQSHGAVLTDAESFVFSDYKQTSASIIEAEAKLAIQKSTTVLGVKVLQAQINGGLSQWANGTLSKVDFIDTEDVKRQCSEIFEHSKVAQRIIEGVRIVIAGPPNSGKSTLLNCLAGQEQVIVSDTAGTTRDWVSVTTCLGDGALRAEFIDTAGLDDVLAGKDDIEQTAQAITKELLESCDLILYVQDATATSDQSTIISGFKDTSCIYVVNKCDLLKSQDSSLKSLCISAQNNEGIDKLVQEILERLGVMDFDITKPISFTRRQQELLAKIVNADQTPQKMLSELLYSR